MPLTDETTPARGQPTHEHTQVEAARHALLRRLAPALRHEAVAHLQPIAMLGGVLERRLRTPSADLAPLQDGVMRMTTMSKAATQSCLDLIGWLAPEPGGRVSLRQAVDEALALLRGPLGFRGFTLRDDLDEAAAPVARAGLRYVLPACLLWLTDRAGAPAEVILTDRADRAALHLRLELRPGSGPGPAGDDPQPAYRPLQRDEIVALARAEAIGFEQDGDHITLTLSPAAG